MDKEVDEVSILIKMLTRIGIGSVKVDTILEKEQLVVGEEIKGVVQITGGSLSQVIDGIHLTLSTEFTREVKGKKIHTRFDLHRERISKKITITAYEIKEIPFTFPVPMDTPITLGRKLVWLHTDLDIKNAVHPKDDDYIEVLPNTLMNQVLKGLKNIGFRLEQVELEEASYHFKKRLPFAQAFKLIPTDRQFLKKLEELEVMFIPTSSDRVEVIMEIDRKTRKGAGASSETLDIDEQVVHFAITEQNKDTAEKELTEAILKCL